MKELCVEMIKFFTGLIKESQEDYSFFNKFYLQHLEDTEIRRMAKTIIDDTKENIEYYKKRIEFYKTQKEAYDTRIES